MHNFITLYIYELKKICNRKISWMTVGLIIALIFSSIIIEPLMESQFMMIGQREVFLEGTEYLNHKKESLRQLNGQKIDDTMLKAMSYQNIYEEEKSNIEIALRERTQYSEIRQYVYQITKDRNQYDGMDTETLYQMRSYEQQANWSEQRLTKKEKTYWMMQEDNIEKPFIYGYAHGWSKILEEFPTLNIMLVLAVTICLSNIFSEEHLRKTDQIILSSRYGKKTLFFSKISAGMTIGLGIGIMFLLIAISSTLGVYGVEGADIAVQISLPLCAYNLTMGQAVFLMGGVYIVSGIFYSVITMFLSEGMNNSIAVMGTMIGCTLLTSLLSLPYNLGIISRIYGLLPSVLLNMEKLCDGRLIHIFRAYFTNFKAAPMIYVAISGGFILGVKRIYDNYQVKG